MKNHHHAHLHHPSADNHLALSHEAIALRAYTLWIEQGCPENQAEENWREAERQLFAAQPAVAA